MLRLSNSLHFVHDLVEQRFNHIVQLSEAILVDCDREQPFLGALLLTVRVDFHGVTHAVDDHIGELFASEIIDKLMNDKVKSAVNLQENICNLAET